MPTFSGSFTLEGDPTKLPATLSVEAGTIRLNSRSHLIGEWSLADVDLQEADSSLIMLVEGERVRLDLRDPSGFISATGVLRPPPPSKVGRSARRNDARAARPPTTAAKAQTPPPAPRRSPADRIRTLMIDLRPDLSEITDRLQDLRGGPAVWVAAILFLAAVVFLPTLVVVSLTIVGTIATLIATFAYLDDSLRVRFPNRMPPVVLLAGGVGTLGLAMVVALLR